MKTIYKFYLSLTEIQIISIPCDAKILSIQDQEGGMCAWVALDTEELPVDRKIYMTGTGEDFDYIPLKHISTVQQDFCVWHFFEDGEAVADYFEVGVE